MGVVQSIYRGGWCVRAATNIVFVCDFLPCTERFALLLRSSPLGVRWGGFHFQTFAPKSFHATGAPAHADVTFQNFHHSALCAQMAYPAAAGASAPLGASSSSSFAPQTTTTWEQVRGMMAQLEQLCTTSGDHQMLETLRRARMDISDIFTASETNAKRAIVGTYFFFFVG